MERLMFWNGIKAIFHVLYFFALPIIITLLSVTIFFTASIMITKTNGMTIGELLDSIYQILFGNTIPEKEEQVVFRVLQSSILFISLFFLAKPSINAAYKNLTEKSQDLITKSYGPWWRRKLTTSFDMGHYATFDILLPMYESAEELIIISGDYSWLGNEEDPENKVKSTLLKLFNTQKLKLFTYKETGQVINRLNENIDEEYQDLINSISHTPHFKVKASFIRHHSYRQFISLDTDTSRQDFLCTINESDETRKTLDFVEKAFQKILV